MEESAIREGFENLQPGSDYDNLYHSALCRQEADWLVGINGTRLFTVLYGGKVLKVERVQTPTLAMLVDREAKIMNFQKETYYMVHILMDGIDAATGRMDDKNKADEIAGACQNGQALTTSVVKEEKAAMPPKLYDLTTLQRDANRLFGFTAKQTLEYTQSLYEKKLATYPRTDSQFLSDDMGQTAEGVIEAVFSSLMFEENKASRPDIKRILNSKKVTDHHAIIPTMEIAKADLAALPETERRILSLVANRLLCATGEKHLYETVKAEFSCNGHTFAVSGKSVTHNGWKSFEDAFKRSFKISGNQEEEKEEKKLPELSEGQAFDGVQTKVSEHFTSQPKHFTELTGGKGITFATGTPISNSMTELYTNMRYLRYNTLQRLGLGHFDSWAASFGETQTAIELAPEGTGYRAKTRFAKFFNLPELIALFKESADIQTPDMLKLPVPEADYENIVLKPSEHQKAMVQSLAERAEAVRDRKVDATVDNMLKITNDGRKLALDQRLINDMLPDEENSKATTCVDKAFEIWEQTKEQKSAQLIFCDLSTPKGDGTFNVYEDIRDKLMAKGVPENEIAFIHDANTETRKAELFAKVRSGQVRFLLGSTAKMGAGTNVQDRLIALHHLDVPWRPSEEGRAKRYIKKSRKIKAFRYSVTA